MQKRRHKDNGQKAEEMFFEDDEDIEVLEHHYAQLQNKKQKKKVDMRAFEYGTWVSRLFLGTELKTHDDITAFLADENSIRSCKARREEYKREFLGGAACKDLWLPYGVWKVRHDVELPFLILVDLPWFNSRSVLPHEATLDEMQQSGRIVHANQTFYDKYSHYAKTLGHLLAIEPFVRPIENDDDSDDFFTEWHTPENFTWYKPMHTTVIAHCGDVLQWSMFLAIARQDIDNNLDRIVVPQDVMVASFAGEIKVLDLHQPEHYAFTYIHRRKKGSTYLVCTKHETPHRPAIGSLAFFSNHTCVRKPWFIAKHHKFTLFKKRGDMYVPTSQQNVVLGSTELYRHRTLTTAINITGRMFRDMHEKTRASLFNANEFYYYIPVEWNYYSTTPKKTTTKCHCLTHCHGIKDKSSAPFATEEVFPARKPALFQDEPNYYAKLYLSQFK